MIDFLDIAADIAADLALDTTTLTAARYAVPHVRGRLRRWATASVLGPLVFLGLAVEAVRARRDDRWRRRVDGDCRARLEVMA